MTTTDLHQYFKVEYDKANVVSSYPSFLPEEIDVWLNKANSMLISLKMTGNNARKIAFEGDTKRMADLLGLIKNAVLTNNTTTSYIKNAIIFELNAITDYLFYINSAIKLDGILASDVMLVSHELTKRVIETGINKPWIPRPVATIEDNRLIIYYDTVDNKDISKASLNLIYLKKPNIIDILKSPTSIYELGDNIAYELINCAVMLALENIESNRLNTKIETITLQE